MHFKSLISGGSQLLTLVFTIHNWAWNHKEVILREKSFVLRKIPLSATQSTANPTRTAWFETETSASAFSSVTHDTHTWHIIRYHVLDPCKITNNSTPSSSNFARKECVMYLTEFLLSQFRDKTYTYTHPHTLPSIIRVNETSSYIIDYSCSMNRRKTVPL